MSVKGKTRKGGRVPGGEQVPRKRSNKMWRLFRCALKGQDFENTARHERGLLRCPPLWCRTGPRRHGSVCHAPGNGAAQASQPVPAWTVEADESNLMSIVYTRRGRGVSPGCQHYRGGHH